MRIAKQETRSLRIAQTRTLVVRHHISQMIDNVNDDQSSASGLRFANVESNLFDIFSTMKAKASFRNILAAFAFGSCLGMASNLTEVTHARDYVLKTIMVLRNPGSAEAQASQDNSDLAR
ncbi:hypothetical protein JIN85_08205 [Luteolibacter pohnpeiensis]|uniref:Uncharacterized protein n=1 Tax=Luteolibacter pohnpeiensis TaxID=454153 RepID=A0A934SBR9_9BACT|nr:hypothetical protein [Luteolibacter pohnpeiensis]MBK1882393.1 hypothetical protein [Luteolibacter pohnpeiensis]